MTRSSNSRTRSPRRPERTSAATVAKSASNRRFWYTQRRSPRARASDARDAAADEVATKGFSTSTCLPASRAAVASGRCVGGGVVMTTTSRDGSARKGSSVVWWCSVGWSRGAEEEALGLRCRIECRFRPGVVRMKGMWKTVAERLGRKRRRMFG